MQIENHQTIGNDTRMTINPGAYLVLSSSSSVIYKSHLLKINGKVKQPV